MPRGFEKHIEAAIGRPLKDFLSEAVDQDKSAVEMARELNVTDKTVRRYLRMYGFIKPKGGWKRMEAA